MKNKSTQIKTKEALYKKLTAYSAVAGAVVGMTYPANAQIQYTDIDPDKTFSNPNDSIGIDLNGDAIMDFGIKLRSGIFSSVQYYSVGFINFNSNSAIGDTVIFGTNTYGSCYALNSNAPINNTVKWINESGGSALAGMYTTGGTWGKWLGVMDKYLGLKLRIGANTYYGWARLDIAADAKSFTIKDYAYEQTPDLQILAGATATTSVNETDIEDRVSLYSFNNEIYINFKNLNGSKGYVTVSNILGQEVSKTNITDQQMKLIVNDPNGSLFIVKVELDSGIVTRKVYLKGQD